MPRGRKKKFKLKVSLNPGFLKSVLSIFFIVSSGVSAVSFFTPTYSFNAQLQEFLHGTFGIGSIFVPFVLLLLGLLLIDSLNLPFKKYSMLFGLVLAAVILSTFAHTFYPDRIALDKAEHGFGGGMLGYNVSQLLMRTVSIYGELLILGALTVLTAILIFNVTLAQIFSGIAALLNKIGLVEFAKKLMERKPKETEESGGELEISPGTDTSQDDEFEGMGLPALDPGKSVRVGFSDENSSRGQVGVDGKPVFEIVDSPREPASSEPVIGVDQVSSLAMADSKIVPPSLPYADRVWELPPVDMLVDTPDAPPDSGDTNHRKRVIKETLKSFGINVEVVDVKVGPSVTQYSLETDSGVRIAKITNLQYDLAAALASPTGSVRIEAPIPGKKYIGIEVPNINRSTVNFKDLLVSDPMKSMKSKTAIVLGKDVAGVPRVFDIARMPHLLVAGATRSGKSVFLHSLIMSILYRATPQEVKFILVDPKRVEFGDYKGMPHLITNVVVDIDKAPLVFRYAIVQMEHRLKIFEKAKVRNIDEYNQLSGFSAMHSIVIVVDELGDIMVMDSAGVEKSIMRLGQLARATGIHLILTVQRPSTDILVGAIKANIPARIAFQVASQIDSRVIIDQPGAEKLLGEGDMLFIPPDMPKPVRLQGAFVRKSEITKLVTYLKEQGGGQENYEDIFAVPEDSMVSKGGMAGDGELDIQYEAAKEAILSSGKASSSFLQRRFSLGYARAARILDQLEVNGVIGPQNGSKPRDILVPHESGRAFGALGGYDNGLGGAKPSGEIDIDEPFDPPLAQ